MKDIQKSKTKAGVEVILRQHRSSTHAHRAQLPSSKDPELTSPALAEQLVKDLGGSIPEHLNRECDCHGGSHEREVGVGSCGRHCNRHKRV